MMRRDIHAPLTKMPAMRAILAQVRYHSDSTPVILIVIGYGIAIYTIRP
jgi:hypothetical protein